MLHYYTDSQIVLHWIYSSPHKWKIFVGNRINQIHETSEKTQWAHVIGEENPSDCCSRGLDPSELKNFKLWWSGPEWLKDPNYKKPIFNPTSCTNENVEKEAKPVVATVTQKEGNHVLQRLTDISSWPKALRVMDVLMQVARNKRFKTHPILPSRIAEAENQIAKLIQQEAYPGLEKAIQNQFVTKEYKHFRSLNPFKDSCGLIRVGGRLRRSTFPYEKKHPIIVPANHQIMKTLILYTHYKLGHAGKQVINAHLRNKWWMPNANKTIKVVID